MLLGIFPLYSDEYRVYGETKERLLGDFGNERVVRVLLPVELIRRVDRALLERRGGFETRAEFFREAVENMLLELTYEAAPPEPAEVQSRGATADLRQASSKSASVSKPSDAPDADRAATRLEYAQPAERDSALWNADRGLSDRLPSFASTALAAPPRGAVIEDGDAQIVDEPLFGLHNRDYPSLWAARQLAELTVDEPVPLSDYLDEVVHRAWRYADELRALEELTETKLRVMFPTNRSKPQSAEEGFRAFAVGWASTRANEGVLAGGPLFSWRMCQLQRKDQELAIALADPGYDLLEALAGITVETPHPRAFAERFLAHLRTYAPEDWWGFETVLDALSREPDRAELVAHFRAARKEWSNTIASTNSQGYVGRAREWGLVEPKQIRGRYVLTDFGQELLEERR